MDNPETLAILITQDTGLKKTTHNTRHYTDKQKIRVDFEYTNDRTTITIGITDI